MADRIIKMILTADTQGLVNGFRNAKAATKDFGSKAGQYIDKNRDSINTVSNALGGFGLAAVGAATLAVRQFMNFDAAMSEVQAATKETAGNMALLRQAALDAGASTVYSASEAAAAITELGKAGLSTDAILSGGLAGALDLAASEGMDVAEAAELTATALSQFNLAGSEASHVADLLAAGAGKAQGSAADLGMALKQGGLVANQFGLSIEETAGGLALFAKQGLIGSDAGTSLKSMLTALANPSKESAQLMEELGINAYDAGGQFVGLDGLAGQLKERLSGLTDAQRQQALAQIFGTDAMRAASVLYSEGAEGVREMTAAVDDQGYAAEAAATRLDNLRGDIEALGGAIETAMIGAGEGANGPLRSLTQSATDAVNAFSSLPPWIQQGTLMLAGAGGLTALGIAGLGKLLISVRDVQVAAKDMGIQFGRIASTVGAAVAVAAALNAIAQAGNDASISAADLKQRLDVLGDAKGPEAVAQLFSDIGVMQGASMLRSETEKFSGALKTIQSGGFSMWMENFNQGMSNFFNLPWEEDAVKVGQYKSRLEDVGVELAAMSATDLPAVVGMFGKLAGATDGSAESQANLLSAMPGLKDALYEIADAAGLATDDATLLKIATGEIVPAANDTATAQAELEKALRGTTTTIVDQTQAIEDNWEAQTKAAQGALSLRDAQRNLEQAVADAAEALKENGQTLDITTEKGRKNQAALDDIASSGWDVIDSMRENGATQKELQGAMTTTRDRFIAAAQAFGMGADEASNLADELGLIPTNVSTKVTVDAAQALERAQAVYNAIKGLPTAKNITVGVIDNYSRTAAQIYSATGGRGGRTFATGGYTGDGGKYEPAGVVHKGEYVLTKEATARIGVDRLNNLNYGQFPGYAGGGAVGGSVTASLGAGSLAAAFDGVELTLVTEAGPLRAFVRTEAVGAVAGGVMSEQRRMGRGGKWS